MDNHNHAKEQILEEAVDRIISTVLQFSKEHPQEMKLKDWVICLRYASYRLLRKSDFLSKVPTAGEVATEISAKHNLKA